MFTAQVTSRWRCIPKKVVPLLSNGLKLQRTHARLRERCKKQAWHALPARVSPNVDRRRVRRVRGAHEIAVERRDRREAQRRRTNGRARCVDQCDLRLEADDRVTESTRTAKRQKNKTDVRFPPS
eukprot:4463675-Pleurochrysis_carterae.AAC.2